MGRVIGLLLVTLSMSSILWADEIQVPFGVYMDEFKSECKLKGLDLEGNKNSQGFVKDEAGKFSVFTYKTATPEQMDIVKDATWKTIRK